LLEQLAIGVRRIIVPQELPDFAPEDVVGLGLGGQVQVNPAVAPFGRFVKDETA
jgi:hypothetical protein